MEEREVVKIASNNPAHPLGYYRQFKDKMKEGDKIYTGPDKVVKKETTEATEKAAKK